MPTKSKPIRASSIFAALLLTYLSIAALLATPNGLQRNPPPSKNNQLTINMAPPGFWTDITTASGPSYRAVASMAYDFADGYVVLFGGASVLYPPGLLSSLGDTWKFSRGSWNNITSTINPPPRDLPSITYDADDGYVLLFGGVGSLRCLSGFGCQVLSDTWISSTSAPPTKNPATPNILGVNPTIFYALIGILTTVVIVVASFLYKDRSEPKTRKPLI